MNLIKYSLMLLSIYACVCDAALFASKENDSQVILKTTMGIIQSDSKIYAMYDTKNKSDLGDALYNSILGKIFIAKSTAEISKTSWVYQEPKDNKIEAITLPDINALCISNIFLKAYSPYINKNKSSYNDTYNWAIDKQPYYIQTLKKYDYHSNSDDCLTKLNMPNIQKVDKLPSAKELWIQGLAKEKANNSKIQSNK